MKNRSANFSHHKKIRNNAAKIILLSLAVSVFVSGGIISNANNTEPSTKAVDKTKINNMIDVIQVPFIQNEGQENSQVAYTAHLKNGSLFVDKKGGLTYNLLASKNRGQAIRENFVTAKTVTPVGEDQTNTKINYFRTKDTSKWKNNVANYNVVNLGEVFDNVDVALKAYGKNVEKIFTVKPGASADEIKLHFEGTEGLKINRGELEINTASGVISLTAPKAFQEKNGAKQDVNVEYRLIGQTTYGFKVGAYDPSLPLIIDPLLASTYLGGTNGSDYTYAIAIDSSNNVYITGQTETTDFPTTVGAYDRSYNGYYDVYVAKFNSNLSTLLASTYLGGCSCNGGTGGTSEIDQALGIAIDPSSGNVFVTGNTTDDQFPTTGGAYNPTYNGGTSATADGFIAKFDSSLGSLMASTYIGGSNNDSLMAIAIDSSGHIFVTGETNAFYGYPTTSGAYLTTSQGGSDVVVSKFNNSLSTLMASTFLGGPNSEIGWGIAIDSGDNIYVTGEISSSTVFPTTGGYQTTNNGQTDAFVTKFNNSLSSVIASTYLGGSQIDKGYGIKLDPSGNVFVTGYTRSRTIDTPPFPINGTQGSGFQQTSSFENLFISKLSSDLSTLLNSSYLYGSSGSVLDRDGLTIDSTGNVYVAGGISTTGFSNPSWAYQPNWGGGNSNSMIIKISNDLTQKLASTYLGIDGYSKGVIALDSIAAGENVYIGGQTISSLYPTTSGAYQTTNSNGGVTLSKLDNNLSNSTIPDAPFILTTLPGSGQVTLIWSAPTNNGPPLTRYNVQWGTVSSGTFTLSCTDLPSGEQAQCTDTTASATISGLTNGTAYRFKVTATNANGTGPDSNIVTETPRPVHYVATYGNDANDTTGCSTQLYPCLTIQHAIDIALTGDGVIVEPGDYQVSSQILIDGKDLIVQGSGIRGSNMTRIKTTGSAAAFRLNNVSNATVIKDFVIQANTSIAIYTDNSADPIIENNIISSVNDSIDLGTGVFLNHPTAPIVQNNIFYNNIEAIHAPTGSHLTATNNTIAGYTTAGHNSYGINATNNADAVNNLIAFNNGYGMTGCNASTTGFNDAFWTSSSLTGGGGFDNNYFGTCSGISSNLQYNPVFKNLITPTHPNAIAAHTITLTGAGWTTDQWKGYFVTPNVFATNNSLNTLSPPSYFLIISNTSDTLTVDSGDLTINPSGTPLDTSTSVFSISDLTPTSPLVIDQATSSGSPTNDIYGTARSGNGGYDIGAVENYDSTLKGYWKFDEASGSTANDSSGNNNNGAATGTTISTTGKFNNDRTFNGSGDRVNIPTISIPNDITVSAWVKSANFSSGSMFVVEKGPVNSQWSIFFEGGYLKWRIGSGTDLLCSAPSNNQWHHIAATQTGTTAKLYIDGTQCNTRTTIALPNGTASTNTIDIGAYSYSGGPSYYFNGDIDDVRLYNRQLSALEISDIAKAAPDTVANLSATSASGTSVRLDFTAPPNIDGISLDHYEVQYGSGNFNSTQTSTSNPITVSGLTTGTSYQFRVVAVNFAGRSPVSATMNATPSSYPIPSLSSNNCCNIGITNVTLAGDNLPAQINNTTATPTSTADTYHDYTGTQAADPASTTTGIPDLAKESNYTFSVNAGYSSGQNTSVWIDFNQDGAFDGSEKIVSNLYSPNTSATTSIFTVASGATTGQTRMRVGSDYSGYQVNSPTGPLQYGEFEDYTVNIIAAPPPTVPGAPTALSASSGNTQATLSWTAPTYTGHTTLTDYKYFYGLTSGFPGNAAEFNPGHTASTATTTTITGLTNTLNYSFYVKAVNSVGDSSPSNTATVTPTVAPTSSVEIDVQSAHGGSKTTGISSGTNGLTGVNTRYQISSDYGPFTVTYPFSGSVLGTPVEVSGVSFDDMTGATTIALGDDEVSSPIPLVDGSSTPFNAYLYGQNVGSAAISSNGFIYVGNSGDMSGLPSGCCTGGNMATDTTGVLGTPNYVVAGAWTDLFPPGGGTTSYKGFGTGSNRHFTIQFNNIPPYGSNISPNNTFQIKLFEAAAAARTPPSAPLSLGAISGDQQVALSWTTPSSDGGSTITSYTVRYGENSGPSACDPTTSPYTNCTTVTGITPNITDPQSTTVSSLTNGTNYIFTVYAINNIGESSASNTVASTPLAPAPTIADIIPPSGTTSGGTDVTIDGGNFYNGTSALTVTIGGNPCTINTTSFPASLTCTTPSGTAGAQDVVVTTESGSATLPGGFTYVSSGGGSPPDAIADLSANPGDGLASLHWTAPNDNGSAIINDHIIYGEETGANACDPTTSPYTNCSTQDTTSTSPNISGLTNDTSYIFDVYAQNANGTSGASNTATATPSVSANCPGLGSTQSCAVSRITGGDLSFTDIPDNTAFTSAQDNSNLPSYNNAAGTDAHDIMSVTDLRDNSGVGFEVQLSASPFASDNNTDFIPLQYLYVATSLPRTPGATEDETTGVEYAAGCSGSTTDVTGSANAPEPLAMNALGTLSTFSNSGSHLGTNNTTVPVVLMTSPHSQRRCTMSQAVSYAVDLPSYITTLGTNIPAGTYTTTFTYTLIAT